MVPFDMLGMVSYSNIVRKRSFFRNSTSKMPWPWKPG